MQDRNSLQIINSKNPGFSRAIIPVEQDFIIWHQDGTGDARRRRLTTGALTMLFLRKASVVGYYYGGKWLKLAGAD